MIIKQIQTFVTRYEVTIDDETNEIKDMRILSIVPKIEEKDIDNSLPMLLLNKNTYLLTDKAIEMLGAKVGDQLVIKYAVENDKQTPVIALGTVLNEEGGNKLTRKHTVSCKGAANSLLAALGNKFFLQDTKDAGVFKLVRQLDELAAIVDTEDTNNEQFINKIEDNEPKKKEDPFESLDLEGNDNDTTINSDFFKL